MAGAGLAAAGPPRRSWWEPFETSVVEVQRRGPPALRAEHFTAVVRGEAEAVGNGRDGLATPQVLDAVVGSARTGEPVDLPGTGPDRRPS